MSLHRDLITTGNVVRVQLVQAISKVHHLYVEKCNEYTYRYIKHVVRIGDKYKLNSQHTFCGKI